MSIIDERWDSRQATEGKSRSEDLVYSVIDEPNDLAVKQLTLSTAPLIYDGMFRDSFDIEPLGGGVWEVRVHYKGLENDSQFTFETGGGSQHITQSIVHVNRYPAPNETAPDFRGAIGVNNDSVDGTDITVPVYNFTETYVLPVNVVTPPYKITLFKLTGKVNSGSFKGFARGECLFQGASGSKRGTEHWEITYRFAGSPNVSGIDIGPITGVDKEGWHYLWVRFADDTDSSTLIKKPVADLSISVTSGYVELAPATFPTNFASMVISEAGAVDSLVQGFLNNTINEATGGRIAGNFDTFFENADSTTTKVVDDIGGVGGGGDATAANQTVIINHLTDIKGGTWNGTTDTLEAIRDRGDVAWITGGDATAANQATIITYVDELESRLTATRAGYLDNIATAPPTAGTIADTVWDELASEHLVADSFGLFMDQLNSGNPTSIATRVINIDVNTQLILADTDELLTDWQDGGRLDALLDSVLVAADHNDVLDLPVVKRSEHAGNCMLNESRVALGYGLCIDERSVLRWNPVGVELDVIGSHGGIVAVRSDVTEHTG